MALARLVRYLSAFLVLGLLAPVAQAAGLSVMLLQTDTSEFPVVRVFVSAASGQGMPIKGLSEQAFELLEEDKPVTGLQVRASVLDVTQPVSVVMAIDISGSMDNERKIDSAKQAAGAFVDSMGPNDSAAIVSFSDQVTVVQPFTKDKLALKFAIDKLATKGDTALYDAVIQSSQLIGSLPPQRKAVVVLTDGDDTKSKSPLDAAVAAAKGAGAPLYAVGLGKDVKREALDKMAGVTAGQAVYVQAPGELRETFRNIREQLRYEYQLEYRSTLPADDKPHNLTVRAKDGGDTAEAKGTFIAKRAPVSFEVKGLSDASQVAGTTRVEAVVLTGTAQQFELLVDEQSRATITQAPWAFSWDTSREIAGIHKVTIRAKDTAGGVSEKKFTVEVIPLVPNVPRAEATAVPTVTVPAKPTPAPTPAPPLMAAPDYTPIYIAIGVLAAAIAAIGAYVVIAQRRQIPPAAPAAPTPAPTPAPPPAPMSTVVTDRTEAIGLPVDGESTVVSAGVATGRQVKGRLHVVHQGTERDVALEQAETILGREATNPVPIKDPLASRRHARIIVENGEFWIEDLKSLNGTRVNGEVITRRRLTNNDQIKIGDALLTFTTEPR